MSNNQNEGRELGWDESISNDDAGGFTLLPEGEYAYVVTSVQRARHAGSAKLPPCNKAVVKVDLTGTNAKGSLEHNLFLHSKTEGLLCQFFRSIGHRKHGEPLRMNWGRVPGAHGRCRISVRKYTKKDGSEGETNDIDFLDPVEGGTGFTPGKF